MLKAGPRKRQVLVGGISLALLTLVIVQLPTLLRLIPSRYLAQMPALVSDLAYSEPTPILPTAQATGNLGDLLAPLPSPTAAPTHTPLPSPLPAQSQIPTSTPSPTPTTATPAIETAPASQRLVGFRHEFQGWNNCGPTTLAMALSYYDLELTQEDTAAVLKPSAEDRNVSPHEMADYVNEQTPYQALSRVNGDLDTVRLLLANDVPVIVEIGLDPPGEYAWLEWYGHYLLIVAYDDAQELVWTYDSWFGTSAEPGANATTEGRPVTYADLETYWQQFNYSYIALFRPDQAAVVSAILGEDMVDETMYGRALAETQLALEAEEENAFLWFNLGTNYTALRDYERAAAAFDQARAIGLPWRMLWYQFGPFEAYYQQARYEEVILLAELTLQERPYLEEMLYYMGLAQAAQGDFASARANLTAAIEFNPNFTIAGVALDQLDASG